MQNNKGVTALMIAVSYNYADVVETLLYNKRKEQRRSIDLSLRNYAGNTAMDFSLENLSKIKDFGEKERKSLKIFHHLLLNIYDTSMLQSFLRPFCLWRLVIMFAKVWVGSQE